jgi:ATP-dependent Clp protease protease subunit
VQHPSDPSASLHQALFDRRIVMVSGAVDGDKAGQVASALISLDAMGDDPIELRLSAESDSLDVAFSLMDIIRTLDAPVNATVAGSVGGTMVGVLAVCRRRRIGGFGQLHLREPRAELTGVAAELERQATDMTNRVELFARRMAEATGRPFEHVEADLRTGRHLDAAAALAYGIVDEVQ